MPRVTVICATYNRSNVLPYAIQSVRGQSFADWEMLIVGDGCTDDSGAVVARVCAELGETRVRWIDMQPGTGNQYGPNNAGIAQARGEFIAYHGHDDIWLPHHLQSQVDALDAGADIAHVLLFVPPEDGSSPPDAVLDRCDAPTAVMHRRYLLEEQGGWRDYREIIQSPQNELWRRLREAGAQFALVPRLTAIKPAACARDAVYRHLPTHEQEYWLRRVQTEPDLEIQILVGLARQSYARELEQQNGWKWRLRFHGQRLLRGQLPRLGRRKPGDEIRRMNAERSIYQD